MDMPDALPSIGYVGGTGPAGSALAVRLASVGYAGCIGSRTKERGVQVAEEMKAKWPRHNLNLVGGDNVDAASRDIVPTWMIRSLPRHANSACTISIWQHVKKRD
ncbi:MAG: hypothetical protein EBY84_08440 [Acidimicrobiia bacterium]|nr:hypothetical protein [Acidimicrobiia bacterium]